MPLPRHVANILVNAVLDISRCAAIGAIAIGLSGCVTRDDAASLAVNLPARWSNGPTNTTTRPPADIATWWRRFRDPAVDRLVQEALANNPGLAEAQERVIAARALARAQGAQRLPMVDGSAQAILQSRLNGPASGLNAAGEDFYGDPARRTVGSFLAGFDARWELDFFGRVRNTAVAAENAAGAAAEEARDAQFILVAEVVRTYLEMRGAEARLSVITREISARRGLLGLVQTQQTAGSAGEFDVQRARSTYEAARARAPAAELVVRVARQRLATLAGSARVDGRIGASRRGAVIITTAMAPLPADLLRWRADIRRAEYVVAQRGAEAEVANAELYPRFALAGTLDVAGNLLGRPILSTPVTFAGGPAVTIPLVDWGMRVHVLRAREAQWRESVAAYRGTVLRAVEDVEIALATIRATRNRLERQRTAVAAARSALNLADRQYRGGLTGLTERLQAETDLRQAELELADATEGASVASVAFFKALGAPPPPEPVPSVIAPVSLPAAAANPAPVAASSTRSMQAQ